MVAITNDARPGNRWRSVGAVVLGFAVVFVLSLGTDQVFHMLEVYPPWGDANMSNGLYAMALAYRVVYQILGCYLTARFAPRNPMRHAWIVGFIGLGLGVVGAIGSIAASMGPAWYPIVLALTALPCAWIGGKLYVSRSATPTSAVA
jgi:hypothetical protein